METFEYNNGVCNNTIGYNRATSTLDFVAGGIPFSINMSRNRIRTIAAMLRREVAIGESRHPRFGSDLAMTVHNTGTAESNPGAIVYVVTITYGRRDQERESAPSLLQIVLNLFDEERRQLADVLDRNVEEG